VLLTFLGLTAYFIIRMRHLFAVVMLSGVFSLLSAGLLVMLDAVDVAFTEAAVGAGISTVLMLGTLALTVRREKIPERKPIIPLVVVLITGAALIYGTLDMPLFGDADAPSMGHVIPEYFEGTEEIFHIPNVVTAVLASYRGFDTLGEVAVVFTAGIGVLILLSGGGAAGRRDDENPKEKKEP
jgi:multicomponent Na+:H+ antiporter subunit B